MNVHRLIHRTPTVQPTLRGELSRTHLGVALAAVFMAGLTVTVVCLWTLSAYAEQNLNLISRSIAYTVEAAVVFDDAVAAEEVLQVIASVEEVSSATVYNRQGMRLALWERPEAGAFHSLEAQMARWLLSGSYVQAVMHDGVKVGEVHLQGSGGRLFAFLVTGLSGMLICLLLTAYGAFYLSRMMVGRIAGPLDHLARVAYAVRRDRDFGQRVPPAPIAEIDELGKDFNALLDELEAWQKHLQSENASLAYRANHDSLTGLPNRAYFVAHLQRVLHDLEVLGGRAAVMFIDCDRFKTINDELGHAAGDVVLTNIATRVRSRLREHDLVARLGGDEFAVLLVNVASAEDALRIADDILDSMGAPIALPDAGRVVTSLTIGIALYPEHASTPEALMHCADIAMYHAKREARGTRRLAHPSDLPLPNEEQEISRVVDQS